MVGFDGAHESEPIYVPPLRPEVLRLSTSHLKDYLRAYNKSRSNRKMSIRIWCRDRPPGHFKDPIILRLILEDVLIAFITLGLEKDDEMGEKPLYVEFVNIFGSCEVVSSDVIRTRVMDNGPLDRNPYILIPISPCSSS